MFLVIIILSKYYYSKMSLITNVIIILFIEKHLDNDYLSQQKEEERRHVLMNCMESPRADNIAETKSSLNNDGRHYCYLSLLSSNPFFSAIPSRHSIRTFYFSTSLHPTLPPYSTSYHFFTYFFLGIPIVPRVPLQRALTRHVVCMHFIRTLSIF
jgi:hypothetical protein